MTPMTVGDQLLGRHAQAIGEGSLRTSIPEVSIEPGARTTPAGVVSWHSVSHPKGLAAKLPRKTWSSQDAGRKLCARTTQFAGGTSRE